jgi:type IV pilus assembly protein PilM
LGFFKPAGAVGLELDTGVVRVAEIKGTMRSFSLTALEEITIPEHAVSEGVVMEVTPVAEALDELWSKARIKKREVVLGISNQGVLMRLARFPKVPEKKLARALRFHAGEYFPIPLSQLVLDHSVISEYNGENGPELEVLLVAARRDFLDKSIQALTEASLKPVIIDASPLALMRTLPEDQLDASAALVDISNGLTALLLIAGGFPRFARVVPLSLQAYAREQRYPMDTVLEQAMSQVASTAESNDNAGNAQDDWAAALAGEIRSSISYYLAQPNAAPPDKLVLSGRGARFAGLPELLEAALDLPVEIINPLARIKGQGGANNIRPEREYPDFAVSIGLALRGLEA